MIDYGYIILFAAAFPIGPVIAMIVSVPELRMKIYTFIYVYKRSKCERSGGMGEWLNILEGLSLVSVFTNFALLYFK
jgi:anoctamin-8